MNANGIKSVKSWTLLTYGVRGRLDSMRKGS